ncbi:MAG: valine--tRNA ligase [Firmicutes bacterium]|nr:valine--tRNA ligase [Bacillota bacterium]
MTDRTHPQVTQAETQAAWPEDTVPGEPPRRAPDAPASVLPSVYDPRGLEEELYEGWEKQGFFHARDDDPRPPYSIVIPPPNVTGQLHLGHALNNTIQDVLIRWQRMQNRNALWMPGTDHAGIATQARVEEELNKEGLSRYDLGREKFLERVWQWKEQYGNRILFQLRRLGCSCDWERTRFTLDEGLSQAVREVFVSLYEKGLIYRGHRIINWCPHCYTALSDIEVEHEDRPGHLWYLRYPLEGDGEGSAGDAIVVATTRPETMLGDTAIAVHPDDERYRHLVGKTAILPILGRRLPIVADAYVDPGFGTGAVKVTPAHDPNDFEIGQRHNLEQIAVIDEHGRMTAAAGPYAGLDRYECRKKLLADLEVGGFLEKTEELRHAVGTCSRCDTVVEPLISEQWFVRMKPLAEPAAQAVRDGRIRFVPERFAKMYLEWVDNVRDWCISRQLWWGHRIPVWYCQDCGETVVARQDPTQCPRCGSHHLQQDPDVLDTWFSSALWPFSTMGWPERTPTLERFYPTNVLVTGFDIIYFWVARMVFMGLEFMHQVPFHDVYITGLIRDAQGRKMSKSLGNGIDPVDVISQYGADALRFSLLFGLTAGYDMRFWMDKVESARNFANKIWNASRFTLMNVEDYDPAEGAKILQGLLAAGGQVAEAQAQDPEALAQGLELPDRWILSRFARAARQVHELLSQYDVGEAARTLYDFTWSELCDWYIEAVKPRLYAGQSREDAANAGRTGSANGLADSAARSRRVAQAVLLYVLDGTLRLLHPFMPFLSEAIWQKLPATLPTEMTFQAAGADAQGRSALGGGKAPSIMVAAWPASFPAWQGRPDPGADKAMDVLIQVVRAIRNLRAEAHLAPGRRVPVILRAPAAAHAILQDQAEIVTRLAALERMEWLEAEGPDPDAGAATGQERRPRQAYSAVAAGVEIFLPLAGLVDIDQERQRLQKEVSQLQAEIRRLQGKLANPSFVQKAPAEVVEKERQRLRDAEDSVRKLQTHLAELSD